MSATETEPLPIKVKRRGLMLVLSSPSGAGKTTIARRLLDVEPELTLSVSVTTRPRRPSEENGVHYHFIDRGLYDDMVHREELLEHAEVYGHGYGTPKDAVESALGRGLDVLFDIDWQGCAAASPAGFPGHRVNVHSSALQSRAGETPEETSRGLGRGGRQAPGPGIGRRHTIGPNMIM